ncbi:MAG: phospholipase D family protein [Acetobacteraceae bacterium]
MEEPASTQNGKGRNARDPAGARTRIALVTDNVLAFVLRAQSARAAVRTLDVQYYIWDEDLTGRLLARELLRAADRGIRVRILLDDLYVRGSERALAAFAEHPFIEVRLYNPFQLRAFGVLGDAVEFLFASFRLNHRMHNKAWIADGALVIAGGRNIGDEYFGAASQFNFRDLDLLISGPAAIQVVAIFDDYWRHRRVRPIGEVAVLRRRGRDLEAFRQNLDAAVSSAAAPGYLEQVREAREKMIPAAEDCVVVGTGKVRVVADNPGKGRGARHDRRLYDMILEALTGAVAEVFIISPYFVPGRRGTRQLAALTSRGVRVAVLTNSLAATDVLAVHGRYARYRRRLLKAGVAMYELKRGGQEGQRLFGSGGASLHTKAFRVDDRLVFVGSFNFDPRSANLNTEMGTFVEDARLAAQLGEEFKRLTDASHSWSVRLERGLLRWYELVAGQKRLWHGEPDTSLFRRILARVLGWLPIEPQL